MLQGHAYLNAGTEGPIPRSAADAVRERLAIDLAHGRAGKSYFDAVMALAAEARAGYAAVLGADPSEVALTSSTTGGVNAVVGGLRFEPGDEILTSDQEHPGVLVPLRLVQARTGANVRIVPFAELPGEVGPDTRLIACSHVSWVGGEVMDVAALRATGVQVLLDGAQAFGAIPVNVHDLGIDFYAGSGQKWLCGPEGSGALYVRPDRLSDIEPILGGHATVADAHDPFDSELAEGGGRLDDGFPTAIRSAWAVASMSVLSDVGWEWVNEQAVSGAERLAELLRSRGQQVAARGRSTLVSWESEDADADVARLAEEGIVVRSIPSAGLVRASVGAWTSDAELMRLAESA